MARAHGFRTSAPQRQFVWSDILVRGAGATNGAAKTTGGVEALGVSIGGGVTLIRSRGTAIVHFDPTSIGDLMMVGLGLGVYSSDAFAVGSTAMPGPLSDADYDWIWHQVFTFGPAFSATEDGNDIGENLVIEVDSKAMRKIKPNQAIGWIAEGDILSGGGTFDFSVVSRMLFKLG